MTGETRTSYSTLLERCAADYDVRAEALRHGYPNAGNAAHEADLQAAALSALAKITERAEKLVEYVRQSGDPDQGLTMIELELAAGFNLTARDGGAGEPEQKTETA